MQHPNSSSPGAAPPAVVVTGLGPVSAAGIGIDALWSSLEAGRTGLGPVTAFDPAGFPARVAGQIAEDAFSIRDVVPKTYRKSTKVMCRDIELAVVAADTAIRDAGLATKGTDPDAEPTIPPERFGCHIGAGLIAADVDELTAALWSSRDESGAGVDLATWGAKGMQNLTPLWLLKYLPNMLACHVTIVHDCHGPSNTITCAEASAPLSMGESMRVIQRGAADACLAGGTESKLNPMAYVRQVFSERLCAGDDPAAVRPYDPAASGTVLGEGGGIVVLESAASAARRGARAYAELAGFAATQAPPADARGLATDDTAAALVAAIRQALARAGETADAIDAVVPLGSGVPSYDAAERDALLEVLGTRAGAVPIVPLAPYVGNCSAGAGGIAGIVACRMLEAQRIPARLHATGTAPLDADASPARDHALRTVLVSMPSQGGQCTAALFRTPADALARAAAMGGAA